MGVGRDSANGGRGDLLAKEDGYLLITVALIGIILAILFTIILPQMHTAQQTRAMNNLNEYRAQEAARKGINAVNLGLQEVNNVQDLLGYPIVGANPGGRLFTINGNYAALFSSGVSIQVYYSTGNDWTYEISNSANVGATTEITVKDDPDTKFSSSVADGYICRGRGVFWGIDQLSGITDIPKYDEYRDRDGNVQFVSGCSTIRLSATDEGRVDVLVIVSRNGAVADDAPDGKQGNDTIYFFSTKSGSTGWLSRDRWPAAPAPQWNDLVYCDPSGVTYFDYDRVGSLSANYATQADVKLDRRAGTWKISVGNDGSFRGTNLWNLQKNFLSGETPFQGVDNDADGDLTDDTVEVFVTVRSKGITAAPGPNYDTDKKSLVLIADAPGSHLPNPMPQMLEAAFFLSGE